MIALAGQNKTNTAEPTSNTHDTRKVHHQTSIQRQNWHAVSARQMSILVLIWCLSAMCNISRSISGKCLALSTAKTRRKPRHVRLAQHLQNCFFIVLCSDLSTGKARMSLRDVGFVQHIQILSFEILGSHLTPASERRSLSVFQFVRYLHMSSLRMSLSDRVTARRRF